MFVAHPCYNRSEQVFKSAQLCLAASAIGSAPGMASLSLRGGAVHVRDY